MVDSYQNRPVYIGRTLPVMINDTYNVTVLRRTDYTGVPHTLAKLAIYYCILHSGY